MAKPLKQLAQWSYDNGTWHLILADHDKGDRCQVLYCRRLKRVQVRQIKNKLYTINNHICSVCESRRKRANNRAQYLYHMIKDRAKRRGQPFAITFAYFVKKAGSEYIREAGRESSKLHLDRKEPEYGYIPGNIRPMTAKENVTRANRGRSKDNEPF